MVHSHLGGIRLTYPTGVKVSAADPMTSGNLPPRLLRVPGVVSRPIRLSVGPPPGVRESPAYYPSGQPVGAMDRLLLGSGYYAPGGPGAAAPLAVQYWTEQAPLAVRVVPAAVASGAVAPSAAGAATVAVQSPGGGVLAVAAPAASWLPDFSSWPTWYWVVGGGALLLLVFSGGRRR